MAEKEKEKIKKKSKIEIIDLEKEKGESIEVPETLVELKELGQERLEEIQRLKDHMCAQEAREAELAKQIADLKAQP